MKRKKPEDDEKPETPNLDEEQAEEQETKYFDLAIEKKDDGSFIAVASTNSVDRHGEVVDNNGWDLKAFKKNPVILWAHDHYEPAIGVSKKTWVEGTGKKAKLMIQPVLHDLTERAKAVKALVEAGIINSLSVGFKPLESPDGVTFTKNELLEVSMVNVPANAEAMRLAYKTLKQADISEDTIKSLDLPVELLDMVAKLADDVDELKKQVNSKPPVKAQPSVNPAKRQTEKRLSNLKVIARASDMLLEADKRKKPVDKKLLKIIKKTTEKLTVAEKESL